MPTDYYLLMEGVNGESQAAGMANNIELESWNFGGSSPVSLGGKGLSGGKPSFTEFSCSFALDTASYQIMKNLCEGTHIKSTTFTGRKTGGGATPYTYLAVTMTNCFVCGFSTGGGNAGIPVASLNVAYEKIEYQYYTQDSTSGSITLAGSATYDIKQVQAT